MEKAMAKVICEEVVNGETVIRSYTTAAGTAAAFVKVKPGAGKPFWCWDAVPPGVIIGADFTNAPIATSNTATNQASIAGITAVPEDVLIYEA
jgi:hypothetical protein